MNKNVFLQQFGFGDSEYRDSYLLLTSMLKFIYTSDSVVQRFVERLTDVLSWRKKSKEIKQNKMLFTFLKKIVKLS